MPTEANKSAKSNLELTLKAIIFGLVVAGVLRIIWAYLKNGSLVDAVGITVTSLALAAFAYWIVLAVKYSNK